MCGSGVVRGQAMPADPPRACGHASWGSHASCQPILLAPVVMRHGGFMCHASRSSSRLWSCVIVVQSGLAPVGRCPPSICHASRVMCHARRHFGCLSHARHASCVMHVDTSGVCLTPVMHHRDYWLIGTVIGGDCAAD